MLCNTVIEHYGNEQVIMNAVHGEEHPENKSFAAATPAASVDITISNPSAKGQFKEGKFYYIDFTEAP